MLSSYFLLMTHLFQHTASTTDLNWSLLTTSVADKSSLSVVDVLRRARRLVDRLASVRPLTVADLLDWAVALSDHLLHRLLLERDLALLLKVLLAELLLGGLEEGDVGVVALLHVLVVALQDRVLGKSLHTFFFHDAEPAIRKPGEEEL